MEKKNCIACFSSKGFYVRGIKLIVCNVCRSLKFPAWMQIWLLTAVLSTSRE